MNYKYSFYLQKKINIYFYNFYGRNTFFWQKNSGAEFDIEWIFSFSSTPQITNNEITKTFANKMFGNYNRTHFFSKTANFF